jgi:glycosyltransferase involved in cell wall biosynthesis
VNQGGKGKGDALSCGFAACTGDVIVMIDADGSTDPREIPLFVEALVGGAEFAKGSRFLPGGGSADLTRGRRIGNELLNLFVNLLYGTRYTDLCYGYNAFWASCLESLQVDCEGFEVETLINIRAAKLGFKTEEIPSFEACRVFGESNLHPIRDGLRIFRTILRERVTKIQPMPKKVAVAVSNDSSARAS